MKRSSARSSGKKFFNELLVPNDVSFVNISGTNATSLSFLKKMIHVISVDATSTDISDLKQVPRIETITSVDISGSPLSKLPDYRIMLLIALSSHLAKIDGISVTTNEKKLARSLEEYLSSFIYDGWVIVALNPLTLRRGKQTHVVSIDRERRKRAEAANDDRSQTSVSDIELRDDEQKPVRRMAPVRDFRGKRLVMPKRADFVVKEEQKKKAQEPEGGLAQEPKPKPRQKPAEVEEVRKNVVKRASSVTRKEKDDGVGTKGRESESLFETEVKKAAKRTSSVTRLDRKPVSAGDGQKGRSLEKSDSKWTSSMAKSEILDDGIEERRNRGRMAVQGKGRGFDSLIEESASKKPVNRPATGAKGRWKDSDSDLFEGLKDEKKTLNRTFASLRNRRNESENELLETRKEEKKATNRSVSSLRTNRKESELSRSLLGDKRPMNRSLTSLRERRKDSDSDLLGGSKNDKKVLNRPGLQARGKSVDANRKEEQKAGSQKLRGKESELVSKRKDDKESLKEKMKKTESVRRRDSDESDIEERRSPKDKLRRTESPKEEERERPSRIKDEKESREGRYSPTAKNRKLGSPKAKESPECTKRKEKGSPTQKHKREDYDTSEYESYEEESPRKHKKSASKFKEDSPRRDKKDKDSSTDESDSGRSENRKARKASRHKHTKKSSAKKKAKSKARGSESSDSDGPSDSSSSSFSIEAKHTDSSESSEREKRKQRHKDKKKSRHSSKRSRSKAYDTSSESSEEEPRSPRRKKHHRKSSSSSESSESSERRSKSRSKSKQTLSSRSKSRRNVSSSDSSEEKTRHEKLAKQDNNKKTPSPIKESTPEKKSPGSKDSAKKQSVRKSPSGPVDWRADFGGKITLKPSSSPTPEKASSEKQSPTAVLKKDMQEKKLQVASPSAATDDQANQLDVTKKIDFGKTQPSPKLSLLPVNLKSDERDEGEKSSARPDDEDSTMGNLSQKSASKVATIRKTRIPVSIKHSPSSEYIQQKEMQSDDYEQKRKRVMKQKLANMRQQMKSKKESQENKKTKKEPLKRKDENNAKQTPVLDMRRRPRETSVARPGLLNISEADPRSSNTRITSLRRQSDMEKQLISGELESISYPLLSDSPHLEASGHDESSSENEILRMLHLPSESARLDEFLELEKSVEQRDRRDSSVRRNTSIQGIEYIDSRVANNAPGNGDSSSSDAFMEDLYASQLSTTFSIALASSSDSEDFSKWNLVHKKPVNKPIDVSRTSDTHQVSPKSKSESADVSGSLIDRFRPITSQSSVAKSATDTGSLAQTAKHVIIPLDVMDMDVLNDGLDLSNIDSEVTEDSSLRLKPRKFRINKERFAQTQKQSLAKVHERKQAKETVVPGMQPSHVKSRSPHTKTRQIPGMKPSTSPKIDDRMSLDSIGIVISDSPHLRSPAMTRSPQELSSESPKTKSTDGSSRLILTESSLLSAESSGMLSSDHKKARTSKLPRRSPKSLNEKSAESPKPRSKPIISITDSRPNTTKR